MKKILSFLLLYISLTTVNSFISAQVVIAPINRDPYVCNQLVDDWYSYVEFPNTYGNKIFLLVDSPLKILNQLPFYPFANSNSSSTYLCDNNSIPGNEEVVFYDTFDSLNSDIWMGAPDYTKNVNPIVDNVQHNSYNGCFVLNKQKKTAMSFGISGYHGKLAYSNGHWLHIKAKYQPNDTASAIWWEDPNICVDDYPNQRRKLKYASAEISTKQRFKYGRIEARIRIPQIDGVWPAFWMFGDRRDIHEIDIFEFSPPYLYPSQDTISGLAKDTVYPVHVNGKRMLMTYHMWSDYNNQFLNSDGNIISNNPGNPNDPDRHVAFSSTYYKDCVPDILKFGFSDDQFHTYAIDWTPFYIAWIVDSIVYKVRYRFFATTDPNSFSGDGIANKNDYINAADIIVGPYSSNFRFIKEDIYFPSDPQHIIFGMAVTNSNEKTGFYPNDSSVTLKNFTITPVPTMQVDWVKVTVPKYCSDSVNPSNCNNTPLSICGKEQLQPYLHAPSVIINDIACGISNNLNFLSFYHYTTYDTNNNLTAETAYLPEGADNDYDLAYAETSEITAEQNVIINPDFRVNRGASFKIEVGKNCTDASFSNGRQASSNHTPLEFTTAQKSSNPTQVLNNFNTNPTGLGHHTPWWYEHSVAGEVRSTGNLRMSQPGNNKQEKVALMRNKQTNDITGLRKNEYISSTENYQIFPNPNKGKFTIQTPESENTIIEVFDLMGQLIYTTLSTGNVNVTIPNSAPGLYLIRISQNNIFSYEKVLVE